MGQCPYKRKDTEIPFSFQRPCEDTARAQLSGWEAVYTETHSAALLMNFWSLELWEINFSCSSHPVCGYFITATLAD